MKYILKINDITDTVNCTVGKYTFSFPQPLAIKKAKAAIRKGTNLSVDAHSAEDKSFGTSSAKVSSFKIVPEELEAFE